MVWIQFIMVVRFGDFEGWCGKSQFVIINSNILFHYFLNSSPLCSTHNSSIGAHWVVFRFYVIIFFSSGIAFFFNFSWLLLEFAFCLFSEIVCIIFSTSQTQKLRWQKALIICNKSLLHSLIHQKIKRQQNSQTKIKAKLFQIIWSNCLFLFFFFFFSSWSRSFTDNSITSSTHKVSSLIHQKIKDGKMANQDETTN